MGGAADRFAFKTSTHVPLKHVFFSQNLIKSYRNWFSNLDLFIYSINFTKLMFGGKIFIVSPAFVSKGEPINFIGPANSIKDSAPV